MPSSSNSQTVWKTVGVTDSSLKYSCCWQNQTLSNKNALKSTEDDANVTLSFQGTQVKVIGHFHGNVSTSRYWLDGHLQLSANFSADGNQGVSQTFFESHSLKTTQHTLVVEHRKSDGGELWLDAFQVATIQKVTNDMSSGSPSTSSGQSSGNSNDKDSDSKSSSKPPSTSTSSKSNSTPTGSSNHGQGPHPHFPSCFPHFCPPAMPDNSMTQYSHRKSVSGGAIAGIVIACVVILGAIVGYVLFRRRRGYRRHYPAVSPDDASSTTIVRIVSYAGDDKTPTPVEPQRREPILPWLREVQQGPPARTNTSSVVLTSVFVPAEGSDVELGEKYSPGPASWKESPPPIPDLPYHASHISPTTPRTAPAQFSGMKFG